MANFGALRAQYCSRQAVGDHSHFTAHVPTGQDTFLVALLVMFNWPLADWLFDDQLAK